jgi:diaminohydroxyphosphoribosylaminopyrimidine deaminase / 5-amino-6-(5-phosphoribosylamino)uracil reductase
MNVEEFYMKRCLDLAYLGIGNTAPNPMVGSIIVNDKDTIIGEGYHQKYGHNHAEVNAINSISNKNELSVSTLYVSLEPCSHTGKTPPCVDLIIKHKIPKVVIGCKDPFSEVNGRGIKALKKAGVIVKVGIFENECLEINKRFFTFHNKKRPYIILKWAQTRDLFIDKIRNEKSKGINWITSTNTQKLTHKWRAEEDAILTGKNTIVFDNPSLTTRAFSGKNPARYVIDPYLEINQSHNIFKDDFPISIFNFKKNSKQGKVNLVKINKGTEIEDICDYLHTCKIQSIIIEGGGFTINQFIEKSLWDEARVLTGNKYYINGIEAPKLKTKPTLSTGFGEDQLTIYLKK